MGEIHQGGGASLRQRLLAPGALVVLVAFAVELAGGGGLLLVPAAVALLALAARPVLLWLAPAEPDALKLALFGLALSPPLALGLWLLLRLALPQAYVLPGLWVTLLALQQLGAGAPRWPRPSGKAAGVALVLAVLCAAVVALALFGGGTAIRASFHGLLHSAITEEVSRSLPPENPWLAGRPLPYYWAWHGLGALLGEALGLAPTMALALTNVWAALIVPLALYFLAAPFLQEPKRDLAAVLLGLFGLGAFGGILLLTRRPDFVAPGDPLQLLSGMRALVGDWDARLAWGPSKFGNLSSYPVALALLLTGWVAAAHALRGRCGGTSASGRTWAILCAASLGASLAMNPLVGAAGFGTVGLVALLHGRVALLVALAVGAVPGVLEVLAASSVREGASFELRLDRGALWSTLLPVLPLALCALPLLRRGDAAAALDGSGDPGACEDRRDARATAGHLLLVATVACLAVAAFVVFPEDNQYKFVRLAAFPLAILAAGGLARLVASRDLLAKGVGVGASLLLLSACGWSSLWGARHYAAWSEVSVPISEAEGVLLPAPGGELEVGLRELRKLAGKLAPDQRPMLLVQLADRNLSVMGHPAWAKFIQPWSYEGHRFRGPYNLQGHEAAAFAGMPLFTDSHGYLVTADAAWLERRRALAEFPGPLPRLEELLGGLARPTFVLVHGAPHLGWLESPTEADLQAALNNGFDLTEEGVLTSIGFTSILEYGEVTIYADERARAAFEAAP